MRFSSGYFRSVFILSVECPSTSVEAEVEAEALHATTSRDATTDDTSDEPWQTLIPVRASGNHHARGVFGVPPKILVAVPLNI